MNKYQKAFEQWFSQSQYNYTDSKYIKYHTQLYIVEGSYFEFKWNFKKSAIDIKRITEEIYQNTLKQK